MTKKKKRDDDATGTGIEVEVETGGLSDLGKNPLIPDETAVQIFVAYHAVRGRGAVVDDLKAQMKDAKADLEEAQDELAAIIGAAEGPGPDEMPLFAGEGEALREPQDKAGDGWEADGGEAWRTRAIDTLDVTPGISARLLEAGLATLGDLAERQRVKGDRWWADVPGVGETARRKVEEAIEAVRNEADAMATDDDEDLLDGEDDLTDEDGTDGGQ